MLNILRSTVKSTFIYSLGNLSSKLVGFILIPLYTSKLSISEFGVLGMLEITSQILIAIIGLSLYNAYFRWYWDKDYIDKQKTILFSIYTVVFAVGILVVSGIFLGRVAISDFIFDTKSYANLIFLFSVVAIFEALNIVTTTIIRLKDKPVYFSALMIVKLLVTLGFTIFFIVYRKKSVEGIYYAQLIGNITYISFSAFFVLKEIRPKFEFAIVLAMLKYSYPLLVVGVTGVLLNITDRYALNFLTDLVEVGKYSLVFKISNTIRVFIITSVNMALQPVLFKMMDQANSKRFYSKVMTYYAFGLMFFVLGLSIFGKEIVVLLSKNEAYWSSYYLIPIISLSTFFTMLRDMALTGINISKKTYYTARIILISLIVNIIFNGVFVHYFGALGAAISVVLSQFLFFMLVYHFAQKTYYIPYELKKIALIVMVSFGLYLLSLLFTELDFFLRIGLKTVLIVLFPFVLKFLNFYEDIELQKINEFWNKWKNLNNFSKNLKSLKEN
ncbi:MAG: lipopolysaccharide biosynthesis protein [Salinivirgaceae bacterium]